MCSIKRSWTVTSLWFLIAPFVQSCYPVCHCLVYLPADKETNVNKDLSLNLNFGLVEIFPQILSPRLCFKRLFPLLNIYYIFVLFFICVLISRLCHSISVQVAVPLACAAKFLCFVFFLILFLFVWLLIVFLLSKKQITSAYRRCAKILVFSRVQVRLQNDCMQKKKTFVVVWVGCVSLLQKGFESKSCSQEKQAYTQSPRLNHQHLLDCWRIIEKIQPICIISDL